MNHLTLWILAGILAGILALAAPLSSQDRTSQDRTLPDALEAAIQKAKKRLEVARQENETSRRVRVEKRLDLLSRIEAARRTRKKVETEAEDLRGRIEDLETRKDRNEVRLEEGKRRGVGLAATLRRGLKTLLRCEAGSLVCLEHPGILERFQTLRRVLLARESITPEEVEALFIDLEKYLHESRKIARFQGEAAGPDGRIRSVDVVRLGQVAAFFQDGEAAGHLVLGEEGCWQMRASDSAPEIRTLFTPPPGSGDSRLPLDPSGGLALRENGNGGTFLAHLVAGGPVMVAIGLLVLVALFLTGERMVFLARARKNLKILGSPALDLAGRGRSRDAASLLESHPGPLARVLAVVLAHPEGGEAAVDHALRLESPVLEKSLGLLGVLGSVAPFLGLLGTVTGLITTFGALTVLGSNEPRLLAGGISEALITTQAGLVVAIPILLTHAFLSSRVDDVADRIEGTAAAFAAGAREEGVEP